MNDLVILGYGMLGVACLALLIGFHAIAAMMLKEGDYGYFAVTFVCLLGLDGAVLVALGPTLTLV